MGDKGFSLHQAEKYEDAVAKYGRNILREPLLTKL
jgi:hypothetical protein